jgi:hypothetical protein
MKTRSAIVAALLAVVAAGAACADENTAGSFAYAPISANDRSGGGGYGAFDIFQTTGNPAAITSQSQVFEVGVAGRSLFGGDQNSWGLGVGYMNHPGESGSYGAALVVAGYSAARIEELDLNGYATGVAVAPAGLRVHALGAYQWRWLSLGIGVGLAQESYGDVTSGGVKPDGSAYPVGSGLMATLGKLKGGVAYRTLATNSSPGLLSAGASFAFVGPVRGLLAGEFVSPIGGDSQIHEVSQPYGNLGFMWNAHRFLDVRIGTTIPTGVAEATISPAGGFTLHWRDFSLDYSFMLAPEAAVGAQHGIGLGWSFGGERTMVARKDEPVRKPKRVEKKVQKVAVAPGGELPTLAVATFDVQNVSAGDGAIITDIFRNKLVQSQAFNVVDKSNMDKILAEQAFQQTGCTTSECAIKLGKLLNVRYFIVGNFGKLLGEYVVGFRAVDVQTSRIVYSDDAKGLKDQLAVADAIDALALRFTEAMTGK